MINQYKSSVKLLFYVRVLIYVKDCWLIQVSLFIYFATILAGMYTINDISAKLKANTSFIKYSELKEI